MGNNSKRARRSKLKAKKNRIERNRSTADKPLDHNQQEYEDVFTPAAATIEFFKTLPCPEKERTSCLSLLERHIESLDLSCDEETLDFYHLLYMAMYEKWFKTGDGSIGLS